MTELGSVILAGEMEAIAKRSVFLRVICHDNALGMEVMKIERR